MGALQCVCPSRPFATSPGPSPLRCADWLCTSRLPHPHPPEWRRGPQLRRRRLSVSAQQDLPSLVSSVGRAIWGRGLPPGILVQVARESWNTAWKVMMSQLAPSGASGDYKRPPSAFRHEIRRDHATFVPEKGRYVLYAALSCPWAHRTLIVHRLKGLGDVVPLVIARPGESGLWEFAPPLLGKAKGADPDDLQHRTSASRGRATGNGSAAGIEEREGATERRALLTPTPDSVNGCQTLKEVYQSQEGGYDGRATVPLIWDTKTRRPVNNESADIIRILNSQFNEWAGNASLDLATEDLRPEMDAWDKEIYENVNNGVYCCGFATTQAAYDSAVERLFGSLDKLEAHLSSSRYLCGPSVTLSDVRLFTTLVRFDVAYHTIFKCTRQKIEEYENLYGYLRDLYQMEGVAETCDVAGVGQSYFGSLFPLNPGGIIPSSPRSSLATALWKPHGRERLQPVPPLTTE